MDSAENSNRTNLKPKTFFGNLFKIGLLFLVLIVALGIFYWRQGLSKNKSGQINQTFPEQKSEQAIKADKISGRVESVDEKNSSFIMREGVASSGKRLFTVTAGERTEFVKLSYLNGYDSQKPPAFGTKSESASFRDLRTGDVVYVHVGEFSADNQINNPTLIEIQKETK